MYKSVENKWIPNHITSAHSEQTRKDLLYKKVKQTKEAGKGSYLKTQTLLARLSHSISQPPTQDLLTSVLNHPPTQKQTRTRILILWVAYSHSFSHSKTLSPSHTRTLTHSHSSTHAHFLCCQRWERLKKEEVGFCIFKSGKNVSLRPGGNCSKVCSGPHNIWSCRKPLTPA